MIFFHRPSIANSDLPISGKYLGNASREQVKSRRGRLLPIAPR
jgi:hypothetical protein